LEKYEDGYPPAWLLRYIGKKKETYIEKCLRRIIYGLGLYGFRHNYYVYAQGHHHFIDWGNPTVKIGFEADSKEWHPSVEVDAARDRRLKSKGWKVTHFASNDLIHHPEHVADLIVYAIRCG